MILAEFAHLQIGGQLVQVARQALCFDIVLWVCICSSVFLSPLWAWELVSTYLLMKAGA